MNDPQQRSPFHSTFDMFFIQYLIFHYISSKCCLTYNPVYSKVQSHIQTWKYFTVLITNRIFIISFLLLLVISSASAILWGGDTEVSDFHDSFLATQFLPETLSRARRGTVQIVSWGPRQVVKVTLHALNRQTGRNICNEMIAVYIIKKDKRRHICSGSRDSCLNCFLIDLIVSNALRASYLFFLSLLLNLSNFLSIIFFLCSNLLAHSSSTNNSLDSRVVLTDELHVIYQEHARAFRWKGWSGLSCCRVKGASTKLVFTPFASWRKDTHRARRAEMIKFTSARRILEDHSRILVPRPRRKLWTNFLGCSNGYMPAGHQQQGVSACVLQALFAAGTCTWHEDARNVRYIYSHKRWSLFGSGWNWLWVIS